MTVRPATRTRWLLGAVTMMAALLVLVFTWGAVEAALLALVVGLLAGAYLVRRRARAHLLYSRRPRPATAVAQRRQARRGRDQTRSRVTRP